MLRDKRGAETEKPKASIEEEFEERTSTSHPTMGSGRAS